MKKVLFVFAIAAAFAACNNAAETPATTAADSAHIADSIAAATPKVDTSAVKVDTSASKMVDTTAKKDTTKK